MEAEIVRDLALSASGLLNPTIGGPSIRPPQPPGIAALTYAGSAKWVESEGADRYRRGLYVWFQRTSPYPSMVTFDAPEATLSCTRRDRSDTPLQSLTLLNDVVFVESSAHAYSQIKRVQPNLVILCVRIEDMDGFQVLSMLKLDDETRGIPVLTYTTEYEGQDSEEENTEMSETEMFAPRPAMRMN